jgi:hypothetical protein
VLATGYAATETKGVHETRSIDCAFLSDTSEICVSIVTNDRLFGLV